MLNLNHQLYLKAMLISHILPLLGNSLGSYPAFILSIFTSSKPYNYPNNDFPDNPLAFSLSAGDKSLG